MKQKAYTLGEEIFSSVTHGVGTLLSVGGTVVLIVAAAMFGDALTVVSITVFGASMIILYCMSTLYHAITHNPLFVFKEASDNNVVREEAVYMGETRRVSGKLVATGNRLVHRKKLDAAAIKLGDIY